jgi:hypothetical protein
MVVGSLASSAHGEPRGTNDMDVVIAVNSGRITELVAEFQRDLYADLKCAQEALAHKTSNCKCSTASIAIMRQF